MKNIYIVQCFIIVICCINSRQLIAQNVVITSSGTSAEASSLLDIKSTEKGILLPRMTANQRNAIISPAKGLLVFQTDGTAGFCYYDGHAWVNLTDGNQVTPAGISEVYALVTTFAGNTAGYVDSTVAVAKFRSPDGMTMDRSGNIYVVDRGNHSIRKITSQGNVTRIAGSLSAGNTNGIGINAEFIFPRGIAADAAGNLYIADTENGLIRKITPAGVVTTFAGDGGTSLLDGTGTLASFHYPEGIATDAAGNVYVSDTYNYSIRKITPAAVVTTLAGSDMPGFANGTGAAASFARPAGLTLDQAGNIYIADQDNHCIRKITPTGTVTTFAGTGVAGAANGTLSTATFKFPRAITMDTEGNFYVADAGNHIIRKITPDGNVSTLAGAGAAGNADGQSSTAYFNDPSGLVVDTMGNLYVTDTGNHTIRKIIIH